MSLYGPKIRMPKVDMPQAGNPSWNLDKEKKIAVFAIIAIIVIVIGIFVIPAVLRSATGLFGLFDNTMANGINLSWSNNPLDLKKDPTNYAALTVEFTNTGKFERTVNFEIINPYPELLDICSTSKLETMLPGDKRTVTCLFRRNGEIFTGIYTIEVQSDVGNAKTKLEIVAK